MSFPKTILAMIKQIEGIKIVVKLFKNYPFIYVDDLCIASQGNDFNNIEESLTSALNTMTTYYDKNQLRANPSKEGTEKPNEK